MDITIVLTATAVFVAIMLFFEQKLESTPDEYAEKLSNMVTVPENYWVYVTIAPGRLLNAEIWEVNKRSTNTRSVCTITYPLPVRLTDMSARRVAKNISYDFARYLCND